ncbi:MAG TPA: hypothetical protein VKT30_17460 [Caulobacteraceae bacterium]|nr:hypothetical protein [Caulobacteraceae bacterium]
MDADGNVIACAVEEDADGATATRRANEPMRKQLEAREAGLEPEVDDPDA